MTASIDPFWYPPIVACTAGGAAMGLLGVYIVGMRIPFVGICISHAAMLGSVLASILGVNPFAGGVVVAALVSTAAAPLSHTNSKVDSNTALAILFSLMLGLTFLFMGISTKSRSDMLGLMWGSVLLVDWQRASMIGAAAMGLLVFTFVFNDKLKALLFSREISSATGIHSGFVFAVLLGLTGVILAVNLPAVGGLLIFSLITNPAAAAYQICRGHRWVIIVSTLFGLASAAGGLACSVCFDLPVGACIVLLSTGIFAASVLIRGVLHTCS